MNARIALATLIAGSVLIPSESAWAATTAGVLRPKMRITALCSIATVGDIVFQGSGPNLTVNRNRNTTIRVTCTNRLPYRIGLSAGANAGADGVAGRRMKITDGRANTIAYQLYRSNTYSLVWGPDAADSLSRTGSGRAQSATVFGRVTPKTGMAAGAYTDAVTVSVTY